MSYYIKKHNTVISGDYLYHKGDNRWTFNYNDRKRYTTKLDAERISANGNGKNGGFSGSWVGSE